MNSINKKYSVKRPNKANPCKAIGSILEEDKPLSQSMIWKLQSNFYANQGPEAWIKGIVPQYITTNPYIANLYAKTVFAYCRDIAASKDFDENTTIYIMELAAGVGRFTYTFLKRFTNILENSSLKDIKFKYIITDLAERNVTYWLNHSYLKTYFEDGILDCATFDITEDNEIRLRYGGEVLKKDSLKSPLILFANYTFDSLPQDTFYVNEEKLYEGLITVTSIRENVGLKEDDDSIAEEIASKDNSILAGLDYEYTDHLLPSTQYYEDPNFNSILHFYKENLEDSAFSFPIIALRCINRLKDLFQDDILIISTDKGYRNLASMEGIYHPFLSKHGSISLTVNFHAMELYFNNLGGEAIHSIYDHENVTMSLFLLSKRNHKFLETIMAYKEMVDGIGPDEFYILKKAMVPHNTTLTSKELLAFLRLTVWDSRTFLEFYNTFLERIADDKDFPKEDLISAIYKVWDHYFPIGEEGNLFFCLGSLLGYFGFDCDAAKLFESSIEFYGEDAAIYYEIALCYYNLMELDSAIIYLDKSLALEPDFEESSQLKGMIEAANNE